MDKVGPTRITAIDLARGIAVALMILSHGVKGLLSFEQFPDWGLVPIHLITKFSSTIFFMVFGLSLAVGFAPATEDKEVWRRKRKKLVKRGLVIFFWYKALTVIEMSHLHSPREILDALLYRNFPSYAEILGFYAIALLWIPFILPFWQRSSHLLKAFYPFAFALIAYLLTQHFTLAPPQLKAILIEDERYYTWGQLSRAPFVFLGMFIGTYFSHYEDFSKRLLLSGTLLGCAFLLSTVFFSLYQQDLSSTLQALALNEGKHPPEFSFILFSLAGALGVLAFTILIGKRGARWLSPLTLIGKDTLSAFVFHLTVLFVFYRLSFGLWLKVSYIEALVLSILLIFMTAGWIQLKIWRKKHEGYQVSHRRNRYPRNLNSGELTSN